MTDLTAKPVSLLSNCTVNISYRFTFYKVSYSVIFLLGVATNSLVLHRLCLSPCTMNSTAIYMASLSTTDLFFCHLSTSENLLLPPKGSSLGLQDRGQPQLDSWASLLPDHIHSQIHQPVWGHLLLGVHCCGPLLCCSAPPGIDTAQVACRTGGERRDLVPGSGAQCVSACAAVSGFSPEQGLSAGSVLTTPSHPYPAIPGHSPGVISAAHSCTPLQLLSSAECP